jgi:hypothetical protein
MYASACTMRCIENSRLEPDAHISNMRTKNTNSRRERNESMTDE